MSAQIPDYDNFARLPLSARRQSLEMIKRFGGAAVAPLFMQVYQQDPDPNLRELARQVLEQHGIRPQDSSAGQWEPTPWDAAPSVSAPPVTSSPKPSALGDIGIGGIKADDALSRKESELRSSFAQETASNAKASSSSPDVMSYFNTLIDSVRSGVSDVQVDVAAMTLDGGTGRPVQRGPQLANLFTLYRGNLKYLTGEHAHLQHNLLPYVLTLGILWSTYAIMFFAFNGVSGAMGDTFITSATDMTFSSVQVLLGVIFGAITVGALALWIRNSRRNRRYETQGQLMVGQVTNAYGRWVSSTDSNGSTSRSYKVTVNYRVKLPDGAIVDHNDSHTRGDLARGGIPLPGSPVAVLAIDQSNVRLL